MRTKKVQKSRQTFRSVGNSVGDGADGTRVRHVRAVGDAVGNAIGNRADGHVSDMRADNPVGDSVGISVGKSVGKTSVNVAKSRNFFATLCEIPTGYIPSVYPSVKR